MNQVINMIIRVIMRRVINSGINAGIGAASGIARRRKQKNPDGSPPQISQDDQPRETKMQGSGGQAKKMMRMSRRFLRF